MTIDTEKLKAILIDLNDLCVRHDVCITYGERNLVVFEPQDDFPRKVQCSLSTQLWVMSEELDKEPQKRMVSVVERLTALESQVADINAWRGIDPLLPK